MTSDILVYIATGIPIGALAVAIGTRQSSSKEIRDRFFPWAGIGLFMGLASVMRRFIRRHKEAADAE